MIPFITKFRTATGSLDHMRQGSNVVLRKKNACPDQRVLCATHPKPHDTATFPQGAGQCTKESQITDVNVGTLRRLCHDLDTRAELGAGGVQLLCHGLKPSLLLLSISMASCTVLLHRDLTHTHVLIVIKLLHNRGEDEGRNHVAITITLLRPWKRCGHTRDNHHGPHH